MAGVNKVILIGHLGADPVVKSFQAGGRVATFSLATGEAWKDKQTGERKERTEWHNIVVPGADTGGLVGVCEKYLRKGSKIYLCGKLRTRKWQDREGKDRWTTEIVVGGPGAEMVMLDGASKGAGSAITSDQGGYDAPALDDEVPF